MEKPPINKKPKRSKKDQQSVDFKNEMVKS